MEGNLSALTPEKRAKAGLRSQIAIVKKSTIYDAIRSYLDDSSVRNSFAEVDQEGILLTVVNAGQSTFSHRVFWRANTPSTQDTQRQSRQQFEQNYIADDNFGYTTADFARTIKPFSTNSEDA
ncbi:MULTISPECIES: hypothetical protein [unclassified Synechococcus]|uniref:hypothetical protein n=1 Tax=unclassified Synechococcus TaxID=2626047 RepID=UPI0021A2FE44|nr:MULTISPECIES: hypothetical protein [unclassified Synechococcus]MCT0212749.1 hypothetical protein [Synechococcus sp. CS-1326]MCT0232580.1 hypothetical protein [Synechococcus sp. CS-1327]